MPGKTNPNPKQVNAVSTHSGLQLEELAPMKSNTEAVNKESEPKKINPNENEAVAPAKKCNQ